MSKMGSNELKGKIIGITRPIDRVAEAVQIVEEHGGKTFVAPTLELRVSNSQSLIELCKMTKELDWLIFTSPTSIISLLRHCKNIKEKLNPNCKIAVIGSRTGNYLEKNGLKADIIPIEYTSEGLLEIFHGLDLQNKKIGIPRTLAARNELIDGLKKLGADVFVAEAYKSELPKNREKVEQLINNIINKDIDAVTFTSSLTVKNLFKMVNNGKKKEFIETLQNGDIIVAAIGPVTAQPLQEKNISVLIPEEFTVKAMLDLLMNELQIKN